MWFQLSKFEIRIKAKTRIKTAKDGEPFKLKTLIIFNLSSIRKNGMMVNGQVNPKLQQARFK